MRPEPDLCDPGTVRAVARRFGLSPNRNLGQNFLVDRPARDRIAALAVAAGRSLIEIGPGLGALTQGLLGLGAQLVAVELDPRCVAALGLLRRRWPELTVLEGDALSIDPAAYFEDPYSVTGNLPYGITGALLTRVLRWAPAPQLCTFLLQREVAERLAASRGEWSLATLSVRLLASADLGPVVPAASFWPRPRVDSRIIRLVPAPRCDPGRYQLVLDLARPAFQQRRKQLSHGLAAALGLSRAEAAARAEARGIDPRRRPGTLDADEWLSLLPGREREEDPRLL